MKFFLIFALSFFISYLVYAVSYLRRIAEALEDLVYGDDEDTEESEVSK